MAAANVAGQGGRSEAFGQYHTCRELAPLQMVILESLFLTNTAEVTMLMTRPTMVIRLGATHIGQRVTNQFQYLGGFNFDIWELTPIFTN